MATAQMSRAQSSQITQSQSLAVMRNLLRASLSTVCYLRNIFSDKDFVQARICDVPIKSLQPRSDAAKRMTRWLEEGVFDALQKRYLRKMIVGIADADAPEDEMLESFVFRVTHDGGVGLEVHEMGVMRERTTIYTKQSIHQATVKLIRTIVAMSDTLPQAKAPRKRIVMRLLYTDETPDDYEPKYFARSDSDGLFFAQRPTKIKLGAVHTPYHSLKMELNAIVTGGSSDADKDEKAKSDERHDEFAAPPARQQQEKKSAKEVKAVAKSAMPKIASLTTASAEASTYATQGDATQRNEAKANDEEERGTATAAATAADDDDKDEENEPATNAVRHKTPGRRVDMLPKDEISAQEVEQQLATTWTRVLVHALHKGDVGISAKELVQEVGIKPDLARTMVARLKTSGVTVGVKHRRQRAEFADDGAIALDKLKELGVTSSTLATNVQASLRSERALMEDARARAKRMSVQPNVNALRLSSANVSPEPLESKVASNDADKEAADQKAQNEEAREKAAVKNGGDAKPKSKTTSKKKASTEARTHAKTDAKSDAKKTSSKTHAKKARPAQKGDKQGKKRAHASTDEHNDVAPKRARLDTTDAPAHTGTNAPMHQSDAASAQAQSMHTSTLSASPASRFTASQSQSTQPSSTQPMTSVRPKTSTVSHVIDMNVEI